ncbi:Pr6Pr family membrane protein [Streptococcus dentiloxodontae]
MSFTQIYRSLLAIIGLIGVSIQLYQNGWGMLLYYTVLSNILVWSFLFYLVIYEQRQGDINQNQHLLWFKGGVTMSIMITGVIYHILLAPKVSQSHFWTVQNIIVHYIVPWAFVADTLFFDLRKSYRWFLPLAWTLMPLLYFGFALINGLILKLPIPGSKDSPFAYFFINVTDYGWGTVGCNVILITLVYTLVGYLVLTLKRFVGYRSQSKKV